jgi:hypothetical protein
MLTSDQSSLPIAGIPVSKIRWFPKNRYITSFFLPFKDPLVWDITPKEITPIAKPYRPLRPPTAGIKPFYRCTKYYVLLKPRIKNVNGRIRISRVFTPTSCGLKINWHLGLLLKQEIQHGGTNTSGLG